MEFRARDIAIRQYQDRIDPRASDDEAAAQLVAAANACELVPSKRPDRVMRLRVPGDAGPPLKRCYLVIGPTGDIIGVQPEHERRGGAVLPEVRDPSLSPARLERELYERAAESREADFARAPENRRHPGARIVGVQRDAPRSTGTKRHQGA